MQNSYWVNYGRLESMTHYAATVRAAPCSAIACHGQMEDHCHARTTWAHIEAYSPHRPGHVEHKPLTRMSHLCCEEAIPCGVLALR